MLSLAGLGVAATVTAGFWGQDQIIYNGSASMPAGFYLRRDSERIERGAVVTIRGEDAAPAEARRRGFTDADDRFLKRVAATGGDLVCAAGLDVSINGQHAARRREHASDGSALPSWQGCVRLNADQALLLGDGPESFDGRYWGPVAHDKIEGVWSPLNF